MHANDSSTEGVGKFTAAPLMSTLQFLEAILPLEGTHFLATMKVGVPGVTHHPFNTLEDMANAVERFDKQAGVTVYHACAAYREPFVQVGEKKQFRTPSNLLAIKSFSIDIDCGPEKAAAGKGHPTKNHGAGMVLKFCKDTGFPEPLIVSSGNGLHCYWLLTTSITADEWKALASSFKAALAHFGVLADPSRTADAASILRPPGSHNKKRPENLKPVRVVRGAQAVDAGVIVAALSNIINNFDVALTVSVPLPVRGIARDVNGDLTTHLRPDVTAYVDGIAAGCNQTKYFGATGCGGNEPLWRAMIGALHMAVDGAAKIHAFSSIDPSYSQAETQRKIDSCIDKPTTCAHIESCNPAGCQGCPSKGKITTPLQLGRIAVNDAIGTDDESDQNSVALQSLQKAFALISTGSTICVIDKESLQERQKNCAYGALVLMKRPDGTLLMQRHLKALYPRLDSRTCIPRFMTSPNTPIYDGVDFRPPPGRPRALNLWVGPTLTPVQGQWSTLKDFLFHVICAGDEVIYSYLIQYIAHALQHPEEKPDVMITLLGGQGIGKGTLFALIMKIWAATTLLTSRISEVVGDFNDSLEGCMFVLLDESHFAGDHKSANALKSLVTAPVVRITPKGQPSRSISSTHRFMHAANNGHAGINDADDRRSLVMKVSEHRKGDREYWKKVSAAVDSETPALMYDLLARDLSAFDATEKPDTDELTKQKIMSLPTIDAFWYDCLYSAAFPPGAEWAAFISTASLVDAAKEFSKGGRNYSQITANSVTTAIKRLCPPAHAAQRGEGSFRRRGFDLTPLGQCRTAFETYLGGKVEW